MLGGNSAILVADDSGSEFKTPLPYLFVKILIYGDLF
jgi:hypothetical protein